MFAYLLFTIIAAANGEIATIINGHEATKGQFPYQATTRYHDYLWCGATPIAPYWVIAAKHCFWEEPTAYRVVINEHDLSYEEGDEIFLNVTEIIRPGNNYAHSGIIKDIALLRVSDAIPDNFIIEMASPKDDFVGQTCIISGWGASTVGGPYPLEPILQYTEGEIISRKRCRDYYAPFTVPIVGKQHICIDNSQTGVCKGDSGGPLVCDGKLAGVASLTWYDCRTNIPSVYASIPFFRRWIGARIKEHEG